MNLTLMSAATFAAGVLGIAGLIFLLQRLRVRHQEVVVVTTLFWREAVQEQRARTLVERFRHPLAYLFAVAIAALLWLGVARPDSVRAEGTRHVLLLDGSAAMMVEGRFEAALDALKAELAECPRDRSEVLFCGEYVRTLLAPGEDRALLPGRLTGLQPQAVPSSVERALAARAVESAEVTRFVLIGRTELGEARRSSFEGNVRVERAPLALEPIPNRGLVALGIAPALSGEWTRVDAYLEVHGDSDVPPNVVVELDGRPLEGSPYALIANTGSGGDPFFRTTIRDLPASGGLLSARLADESDGFAVDDRASLRLPNRPQVHVAITDDSIDAGLLRQVLALDPAVQIVDDTARADVFIGSSEAGRPALKFAPASEQQEAILVGHAAELSSQRALELAVGELALDRVDASALAEALGRPIAVGAHPTAQRSVSLWSELLDGEAGFVRSRSFPLLVGRAVRWLAQVEPVVPYEAAARVRPSSVGESVERLVLTPLSSEAGGLLARGVTTSISAPFAGSASPSAPEGAGAWRPYTWFLLLALACLGVEWILFRRGRMA